MQLSQQVTGQVSADQSDFMLEALRAAIAGSPIVARPRAARLPAGFEAVDVAILDWIVAEARHLRRSVPLM